jgi:hypothetical protein
MLKRRRSKVTATPNGPVGTEAAALENAKQNAENFSYPTNGFLSRIEYSLIYAIVSKPDVFPPDAVLAAIAEEDFSPYLYARPERSTTTTEHQVSYAQLTAILATAGELWSPDSKVAETLCNRILKYVVKFCEDHDLDRKAETEELLQPLLRYSEKRNNKVVWAVLVPAYIGYCATMLTANPLPLIVSMVVVNANSQGIAAKDANGSANMDSFVKSSHRVADVEQTSLLDECEEYD